MKRFVAVVAYALGLACTGFAHFSIARAANVPAVVPTDHIRCAQITPDSRYREAASLLIGEQVLPDLRVALLREEAQVALKTAPGFIEMERKYPGLARDVTDNLNIIIIEKLKRALTELKALWEQDLRSQFTANEMCSVIDFGGGPIWRSMLEGKERYLGRQRLAALQENALFSETSARMNLSNPLDVIDRLSRNDQKKALAFLDSKTGKKVFVLADKLNLQLEASTSQISASPEWIAAKKDAQDRAIASYRARGK